MELAYGASLVLVGYLLAWLERAQPRRKVRKVVFKVEEQDPNEIEYFEFSLPGDDTVHRVPYIGYLGVELVERMEAEGLQAVMETFGDEVKDGLRSLNGKQLRALIGEWRRVSRMDPGESSDSDDT